MITTNKIGRILLARRSQKARNENLQKLDRQEVLNDPVYKKDEEIINKVKEEKRKTSILLKKDQFD